MLRSTILKFCRATAPPRTCSIVRSRDIGICPSTPCTSRSMATRSDIGSVAVRTAHDSGRTLLASAVSPSVIWLCGTYITPTFAVAASPFSRTLPTIPTICRGGSSNCGPSPLPMTIMLSDRILLRPVLLRHRVVDDRPRARAAPVSVSREHAPAQQRDLEHAGSNAARPIATARRRCTGRPSSAACRRS